MKFVFGKAGDTDKSAIIFVFFLDVYKIIRNFAP